jgi:hypothetical protein
LIIVAPEFNCYDTLRLMMAPRHELVKGPLRPPKPDPLKVSYTQPPASKYEVSVKVGNKGKIPGESEFG